jgi:hypothetical protein
VSQSLAQKTQRKQELEAAKTRLKTIETTVRDRLKKNLIKELLRLTFETVNQVVSPGGEVQFTVKGMFDLAADLVVDAAKSHFSASYTSKIEGLRSGSKDLLRELDQLDRAMKLSREGVIAGVYKRRGEDISDKEKAILFAKYGIVADALKKADDAIDDYLQNKLDPSISSSQAELARLRQVMSELNSRIIAEQAALENARQLALEEAESALATEAPELPDKPLPEVTPREPDESNLDQYKKIYQSGKGTLDVELPSLVKQVVALRQSWLDSYQNLMEELQGDGLLAEDQEGEPIPQLTTRMTQTVGADTEYSIRGEAQPLVALVNRHAWAVEEATPFFTGVAESAESASAVLGTLREQLVALAQAEQEIAVLRRFAESVNDEYVGLFGATPSTLDLNLVSYLDSLTPEGFEEGASVDEKLALFAELDSLLSGLPDRATENLVTLAENIELYERVFPIMQSERSEGYRDLQTLLTNLSFAFGQIEQAMITMEAAIIDAGLDQSYCCIGKWPYQRADGQSTNITTIFSGPEFRGQLQSAFKAREWARLAEILANHESLVGIYHEENLKYSTAWMTYFDLWHEAETVMDTLGFNPDFPEENDLSLAAGIDGALLNANAPNLDTLQSWLPSWELGYLWTNFEILPPLEQTTLHEWWEVVLFEINETVDGPDSRAWLLGLDQGAFLQEVDHLRNQFQETVQGLYNSFSYIQTKSSIDYVQMRLNGLVYEWGELNGVTEPPSITRQPMTIVVPAGQTGHFRVEASGEALIYEWVVNGQWIPYAITPNFETPPSSEPTTVWVRVRNFAGYEFSEHVSVTPTSDLPLYQLSKTTVTMAALGGESSFAVATTPADLSWKAESDSDWIEILDPAPGRGSGTVYYHVGVNEGPDERTGTIQLGDQTHTVTQEAASWTYETWRDLYLPEGGDSGPDDDFSGDGLSNFANYARGFDPRRDNRQLLLPPQIEEDENGDPAIILYSIRSKTAQEVQFTMNSTPDLRSWTELDLPAERYSQYPNSDIYRIVVPITPGNESRFFQEDMETGP